MHAQHVKQLLLFIVTSEQKKAERERTGEQEKQMGCSLR